MEELFSAAYFMRKALDEAHQAYERGEVPIGAVIVANNTIIAKGHNLTETLTDVTAHAEMQAITSASSYLGGKYLKNAQLYVTLEPCIMCAGALYWSQISQVFIGARDEKRGFMQANIALHPQTKIEMGILEEECSQLIKQFFASKR
ncbi:MAG TPA: nucleoside deaminase [Moheibacter sp.]|nr:nucleoside deaminase [Moheibacter sp.]